ncbi:hypothetical protein KP509_08G053400 [Ceratopteris richardii]|uniref:Uncharacterized protein n=1 Tax=Ceratopteris richardii TaxID=49495 RepID=A0A8T2U5M1_CERRI|nr:hypothetical protein KP509_08G053400 [Ceratopteris richardii]
MSSLLHVSACYSQGRSWCYFSLGLSFALLYHLLSLSRWSVCSNYLVDLLSSRPGGYGSLSLSLPIPQESLVHFIRVVYLLSSPRVSSVLDHAPPSHSSFTMAMVKLSFWALL